MKYLKKYKIFTEEAEFDVDISDTPDIKMSKEKFQTISNQLKEFKMKKPQIDNIYKSQNDSDIQLKIEQIVGKVDKPDRNPFLIEYLHVASLKIKVEKLQKEIVNDKVSKDDFTQQISLSTDKSTKDVINKKIIEINNRISEKNNNIQNLNKDIELSEKNLNIKMANLQKEMSQYIKNISNN